MASFPQLFDIWIIFNDRRKLCLSGAKDGMIWWRVKWPGPRSSVRLTTWRWSDPDPQILKGKKWSHDELLLRNLLIKIKYLLVKLKYADVFEFLRYILIFNVLWYDASAVLFIIFLLKIFSMEFRCSLSFLFIINWLEKPARTNTKQICKSHTRDLLVWSSQQPQPPNTRLLAE